jgi:hypothetical protein
MSARHSSTKTRRSSGILDTSHGEKRRLSERVCWRNAGDTGCQSNVPPRWRALTKVRSAGGKAVNGNPNDDHSHLSKRSLAGRDDVGNLASKLRGGRPSRLATAEVVYQHPAPTVWKYINTVPAMKSEFPIFSIVRRSVGRASMNRAGFQITFGYLRRNLRSSQRLDTKAPKSGSDEQMALNVEGVVDRSVGGEKSLG